MKSKKLEKPLWLKYTEDEVKSIILKLANKGMTAEKIGLILRDQYGIPKVKIYNLKIKKVIQEAGNYEEPTNKNLQKKIETISAHNKSHKGDRVAERSLSISKAKLKKRDAYENQKNNVPPPLKRCGL